MSHLRSPFDNSLSSALSEGVCFDRDRACCFVSSMVVSKNNSFAQFPGGFLILKPESNESHKDEYKGEISTVPRHSGKLPPYKPLT